MTANSTSQFGSAGPFFAPMHAYFGNLDSMSQSMSPLKGIARSQLELMGFFSRRTQAYMEIPSRMQQCRTPQDLLNEQARFWQTAFEQYAETSRRMMEAWSHAGLGAQQQPVRATARDYINFGSEAVSGAKPLANGHDRKAA
ncbi:MAG: hypothetical protein Q7T86_06670 [Hyphomicrobiaceae bacterium]|nr:hypothetical protein [Hyphomicrobiaceae bacterium]